MSWKEFFRPTFTKIILSLIVFTIMFLIFGIPVKVFTLCECKPGMDCSCPMTLEFRNIKDFINSMEFIGDEVRLVWYLYIIEFIVSYLISSLIIFLVRENLERGI